MKKILQLLFITFTISSFAQSNNYIKIINQLKQNNDYSENVICYNSTMLAKAEFYIYNNSGYVVAYIKQNEYDYSGNPYIFCNISKQRWQSFKNGGYSSWGESFNQYIRPYTCENSNNNSGYRIQQPKSLLNVPLITETLDELQRRHDANPNRNYANYTNYYDPNAETLGKNNLDYNFAVGYGLGLESSLNSNQFVFAVRISKTATFETLFSNYTSSTQVMFPNDLYDKQYGLTAIFNLHASLFSKNLFFVLGGGGSYSKTLKENTVEFENKYNPVINLGLDYNIDKIPFSIGLYMRLDFGKFSSTGLCLKYIHKNGKYID